MLIYGPGVNFKVGLEISGVGQIFFWIFEISFLWAFQLYMTWPYLIKIFFLGILGPGTNLWKSQEVNGVGQFFFVLRTLESNYCMQHEGILLSSLTLKVEQQTERWTDRQHFWDYSSTEIENWRWELKLRTCILGGAFWL